MTEFPAPGALLESVPERWLRRVPGRETFPWPGAGEPLLAVKRYEGDQRRDRWYERLRGRPPRSPAQREFDNLVALARAGFPVPEAVGWAEDRGRRRSVVSMRWVPHGETLRERLEGAPTQERALWLDRLARLVARLHGAGFYHRDLYVHHFVLAHGRGAPDLTLLDLGRVRREVRPLRRWLVKDLGALAYSLPSTVTPPERALLFGRYFDLAGPATLPARAGWLRAVERRRRRIAAHVPRHGGDPE